MKRFVWRLQRVLDVKTKEEQIRKAQLIAVTERLTRAHGELLAQKRILEEIISELAGTNPKGRLQEQEFFLKHSESTNKKIKEIEKKISDLEQERKQKTTELLKVRRFKEGLDRLRAEDKARFIEEQEKIEQKDLDEIATIQFSRKNDTSIQKKNVEMKKSIEPSNCKSFIDYQKPVLRTQEQENA